MRTIKKIYSEESVETQCNDLKWAVVAVGYVEPKVDRIIALLDSKSTADYIARNNALNYPKDRTYFEVREVDTDL